MSLCLIERCCKVQSGRQGPDPSQPWELQELWSVLLQLEPAQGTAHQWMVLGGYVCSP